MSDTVSIGDILASIARRIKKIIIWAVIGGLLLGGLQGVKEVIRANDPEQTEALVEYERKLRDLEKTISRAQTGLENERDYISKSLFMALNPYECYVANIYLNFADIIIPQKESFGSEVNPIDYATGKIQDQYIAAWSSMDLPKSLGLSKYAETEDRYIREIASVIKTGSGIRIMVHENDSASAEALASAVLKLVRSCENDVSAASYRHSLLETLSSNKQTISESVRTQQIEHYDAIDDYVDKISVSEEAIKKLDPDDTPIKAVIKKGIVGGIAGLLLSAFCFVLLDLFNGTAQSSGRISAACGLECLGSLAGAMPGKWNRFVNGLAGEKIWKSQEDALEYLAGKYAGELSGKVLVSSTQDIDPQSSEAGSVLAVLKDKAVDCIWQPLVCTNPDALKSLETSDSLILIEESGKSRTGSIKDAKALAEKLGKKCTGFVLI